MRNIWMLSAANIRKNKGQSVSLLIFVLIAAMFLNLGLTIFMGIGSFFDERAESVHMAHYTAIYQAGADAIDKGLQYMASYPSLEETETLRAIGGWGDYYVNDTQGTGFLFLSSASSDQKMDAPSLIGESLPLTDNAIYIPYFIMRSGGYRVGDDFKLNLSGTELNFTVAGSTAEIMFGAQFNTIHRFYVSEARFSELEKQFPENGLTLISARFENSETGVLFQADYNKVISTDGLYFDLTYDNAKQARTMIPLIAAIVVTAFALILLAVSLMVIRFRIANSIEESMTNIGTQKAVGYRSAEIVAAIVVQYAGIALSGGLAGIALSQAIIPSITKLLEPLVALVINLGFDAVSVVISLGFVLLAAALISFISARRINKLHPLVALRGGLTAHSFKKNALPLDKGHGPLSLLLALKLLFQNKKQAVAVGIIVAAVTMASVAGIAVNYNMNEGRNSFARSLFGEMPEVNFVLKSGEDGAAFGERLLARPEVRKVLGYEVAATLLVDETGILATVVEDCALLEGNMIIDGRYPRHNNEIALGPSILKVAGKKIGDTVMVKSGRNEKEYLITGIVQFMQSNGFNGIITDGGIREIQPDFIFTSFNAYLTDEADTKTLIDGVRAAEGAIFDSIMDVQDNLKSTMDTISGVFAAVAIGIVAVTALVVILVLYMVIKAAILQRRRELGIQKAVGFTTFQLMNQIALNMTPMILFGVILGAIAGYFGLNPMMTALMSGMGIVRVQLPVPIGQTITVGIALVALAYAVSLLIAWRIRKVSAYAMISE
ncbi:MAG: ABC transporter permease [Dehalococcoidia bacterium]|nr:ABC transporter permease [Dehalococcoidia bacterium]